jgi:hypothetical protein
MAGFVSKRINEDELKKMCKEEVLAEFRLLSLQFAEGTEENH